MYQKNIVKY